MADLQKIAEDLSGLTVLEAAELAKLLEEKWGVSAAAAVAVAAAPGAAGAAAAVEEKTEFTVVLAAVGEKKIEVIKEVRALTSCATLVAGAWIRPTILARSSSSDGSAASALTPSGLSAVLPIAPPRMTNFSFALAKSTATFGAATGSPE